MIRKREGSFASLSLSLSRGGFMRVTHSRFCTFNLTIRIWSRGIDYKFWLKIEDMDSAYDSDASDEGADDGDELSVRYSCTMLCAASSFLGTLRWI
jgi:hypothetical protein